MKKALVLAIFVLAARGAFSNNSDSAFCANEIGAGISSISGGVVYYQRNFDEVSRLRINFWYYFNEEDGEDLYQNLILGGEYHYTLHQYKKSRFYFLFGASLWYYEDNYSGNDMSYGSAEVDREFRIGPGVGFELTYSERYVFNLHFGFNYITEKESAYYRHSVEHKTQRTFSVGGGLSFGYRF